jgi:Rod binding domain-containing protein
MIDSIPSSLIGTADFASPIDSSSGASSGRDTPEAIEKAATQFEALLIGEVMKSAREADGSGWMGTDEDEAGSTLMDVSEQQISQALASSGGLGLAKMISTGLSNSSAHRASRESRPAEKR